MRCCQIFCLHFLSRAFYNFFFLFTSFKHPNRINSSHVAKMRKQKNILSFFKPLTPKQTMESAVPTKKPRFDGEELSENKDSNIQTGTKNEKIDELSKTLEVLDSKMGDSWFAALEKEFAKPYFKKLSDFVTKERESFKIYPDKVNVWSWTKYCKLEDVKVVIIGQDPYHNPGQAHGLCFSVQRGVKPPPSLMNIYKELVNDIPGFERPDHGDLTSWATQGVLLLNACLTVRENAPNSHADKGWENITDAAIKAVSEQNSGVVFLLWGAFAQKKALLVDKKKHHILKAPHPSPLSASRGFFGCKHFSQCNKLLADSGKKEIEWDLIDVRI